jgi:hypothetical protein
MKALARDAVSGASLDRGGSGCRCRAWLFTAVGFAAVVSAAVGFAAVGFAAVGFAAVGFAAYVDHCLMLRLMA